MKVFPVMVASIGLFFNASCEKTGPADSPKSSNGSTGSKEPQLIESKKQLATEISEQQYRIMKLQVEISEMKGYLDELRPKTELLDAEKKLMFEDVMKLKKRWENETEGIYEEPSSPIHVHFREMIQKMDQLLQENQELKRKLEATAK